MRLQEMSEEQFKMHQMKKINKLFKQIDEEFYKLNTPTRYDITEYHDDNYSLTHCIRWGLQATEEFLEVFSKSVYNEKGFIEVRE